MSQLHHRSQPSASPWAGAPLVVAAIGVLLLWWGAVSAQRLANWGTGNGYVGEPWLDISRIIDLVRSGGPSVLWEQSGPVAMGISVAVHLIVFTFVVSASQAKFAEFFRPGTTNPQKSLTARTTARQWKPSKKEALKLCPVTKEADPPGLYLGDIGKEPAYMTKQDTGLAIMPPRAGKTTALAIPMVCRAPGPAVVTSNKSDVVDGVRAHRSRVGRVWVFDPQDIASEPATWWWDPLFDVSDRESAHQLATSFVEISPKAEPFWPQTARNLLALMFLAAKCGDRPITDVGRWVETESREPINVLRHNGHINPSDVLETMFDMPEKTRAGVFSQARLGVSCLEPPRNNQWVTPHAQRAEFRVDDFFSSSDTLCLLSQEGQGTCAPLLTAFVRSLFMAGMRRARLVEGGRLDPPTVIVLDEAANICRIEELPDLYSHIGSRGLPTFTILQSPSQGAVVWGDRGFESLWTASTIRLVGSGVNDAPFLNKLSNTLGNVDRRERSLNEYSGSQRTISSSVRSVPLLDAAEISNLPAWRAVLTGTGRPAAVLSLQPWWKQKGLKGVK